LPVNEQYGSVYRWHHSDGDAPSWPVPNIFLSFPQVDTNPAAYYEPMTAKATDEPVHPQVVVENGPDSVHLACVHHASGLPLALHWEPDGPLWKVLTGGPNTWSNDSDEAGALRTTTTMVWSEPQPQRRTAEPVAYLTAGWSVHGAP
jgi:hypothetical protein